MRWTSLWLAGLLAMLSGCASSAPSSLGIAFPPNLPNPGTFPFAPARQVSAAQFKLAPADVVAARGASWAGTTLNLSDPEVAYVVLAVATPADYTMLHLGCSDNGSGAWVAVSDRSNSSWRWLGHIEPGVNGVRARYGDFADAHGVILFALVAAGETFSSPLTFGSTTASLLPPDDWPLRFTVPAELEVRYAEMLEAFAAGDTLLEWAARTDVSGRRAACYYQMQGGPSARDEMIVGSLFGEDPVVDDAYNEFALLIDSKFDMFVHFSQTTIADFDMERPLTKSERAWYADQILLHYPDLIQFVEPNGVGGPPP